MIAWQLWQNCSSIVWNQKARSVGAILNYACGFLVQWQRAQLNRNSFNAEVSTMLEDDLKWTKP